MRIPVLCYHSQIITGNDYRHNGHRALAHDLDCIQSLGLRVVPLTWVAEWQRGERNDADLHQAVAISFDDGMSSDFRAVQHPEYGELAGFLPILEAFQDRHAQQQEQLHATAFVIASDRARRDIDQACHDAIGWDDNSDWEQAAKHPLLSLENHSWDHNHETCNESPGYPQGNFHSIHNFDLCEFEIRRSSEYLKQRYAVSARLFAYPYGHTNPYLSEEYLPQHGPQMGLEAAFTTAGSYVERGQSRWLLPRFVHGFHWRDETEFAQLLQGSQH